MKTTTSAAPDDGQPFRRKNPSFKAIDGKGRTLPHSIEAEEYLLSCCLLDGNDVVRRCLEAKIMPRHFYLPAHGIIFEVILELYRRPAPIDVSIVAEELKTKGQLDAVGGYPFLMQVSSRIPTTAQAGYFIEKVRELAILRRIIRDGEQVVEDAYTYSGDLLAYTGVVAAKFQAIADEVLSVTRKMTQKAAAAHAHQEALDVAAGRIDKTRWLHFPVPKMDSGFLPIDTRQEDWLNIFAAPPSGGKSSYLRWLAWHWLLSGKKGVVFLLETSRKRWLQALAALFAGVNLRQLEDIAKLHPNRFAQFEEAMKAVESWMEERLWVFDDVIALEDIQRVTRDVHRVLREREMAAGVTEAEAHGLDFVVGDYLQIVTTRRQFLKRTEELAHITKAIKQLHRSLDVPGFWGAQITREARNEGRRPTLADLGESKALEENADRVHFLHQPPIDGDEEGANERTVVAIELIQRKSRNGPKDVCIDLEFDRGVSRFRDPSGKAFANVTPPKKGPMKKGDFR